MTKFRFSKNRSEIISVLNKKLTSGKLLTVWQKNDDGTRSLLERMAFRELFSEEGVFTLNLKKAEAHGIDEHKEIYFLLEEHDFIFKTRIAIDQKEFMTFQLPKEVRLIENRSSPRTAYSLEDRVFAEVILQSKLDGQITLTCPIISLSDGGACIVISRETISNIDLKLEIKLKIKEEFLKALARNARVYLKKNLNQDELYAIGVQFQ